jgi:SAM-dependent methyltransferase
MEMKKFEKGFVNSKFCNFLQNVFLYPKFFVFIGKELKGRALEIGCGIGETTNRLSKKYKKLYITAIDYDLGQIIIAKRNNRLKNVNFMQGDATNLRLKNSSLDYVIETDVFHHIKNYSKAVEEAYRVLKRNGHFYLIDISKYAFTWPIRVFFPPESLFTKKEFIRQLQNKGFKIEKSSGNLFFFIAAKKI